MSTAEANPAPLRVLIVDRHEVSRAAIRALLQTEGLEVVADVSTGEEALAVAGEIAPDIAIVDIGPDAPQALALARSLGRLSSSPTVVLASTRDLDGGVDGYAFLAKADICARRLHQMTNHP